MKDKIYNLVDVGTSSVVGASIVIGMVIYCTHLLITFYHYLFG